jgi:nucleotide-binding universal stress UspA family protein
VKTDVPSFRHVVAVTDLSDAGNAAIRHAFAAVRRNGAVSVVHLIEEGTSDAETRQRVIEDVRTLAVKYRRPAENVALRVELIDGHHGSCALFDYAERHDADLICIAGPVSQQTILSSRKPVLVIPAA